MFVALMFLTRISLTCLDFHTCVCLATLMFHKTAFPDDDEHMI